MRVLAVLAYNLLMIAFFALVSLSPPDPTIPDGDPCCTHPDTWREVGYGLMWTFGFVVIEGLILALVVGLTSWAVRRRWPAWRWLALVPVATVVVAALLIAIPLLPLLDEGWTQLP